MRAQSLVAVIAATAVGHVAAQITGKLGDATVVSNPAGYVYEAVLPEEPFWKGDLDGNVKGSVLAMSAPDGNGVEFKVKFSNLPKEGGPFAYHIHVAPVPKNGNCTKTLAHQDPFIRGEATPCDINKPETCQTGDLSGKHGAVNVDGYEKTYVDEYLSIVKGPGSFIGNRSVVLHFANKTRITCANFKLVSKHGTHGGCNTTSAVVKTGGPDTVGSPSSNGTSVPFPGAAATSQVSVSLLFVAFAAAVFSL